MFIDISFDMQKRIDRFLDILSESNKIKREAFELEKEKAEVEINGTKQA